MNAGYVRITTTDGQELYWHKGGQRHVLSPDLGPRWVQHFQPVLFQVLPDGNFVPRGSHPDAIDVERVALEAADEAADEA